MAISVSVGVHFLAARRDRNYLRRYRSPNRLVNSGTLTAAVWHGAAFMLHRSTVIAITVLMSNADTAPAPPQHSDATSHEVRVGMSVYWIKVAPAEDGWFRWESVGGVTGMARSVAHCIEDARQVFFHREAEAAGTAGT